MDCSRELLSLAGICHTPQPAENNHEFPLCPAPAAAFNTTVSAMPNPQLSCKVRFILLTHPKELNKDTNTGDLMLRTLPNCQRYTWDRVNPPSALLEELRAANNQPWLLFPQ